MIRAFIQILCDLFRLVFLGKPIKTKPEDFEIQTEGLFLIDGNEWNRVYISRVKVYDVKRPWAEGYLYLDAPDSGWIGMGLLDKASSHYVGVFRYVGVGPDSDNILQDSKFDGVMGVHEITFTPGFAYTKGYNVYVPPGSDVVRNKYFGFALEYVDESSGV